VPSKLFPHAVDGQIKSPGFALNFRTAALFYRFAQNDEILNCTIVNGFPNLKILTSIL